MKNYLFMFMLAVLVAPGMATVWDVNLHNFVFTPANLTIQQGDTVRWTNTGGSHNVHHVAEQPIFHSGNVVGPGPAWPYSFAFTAEATPPGTYNYVCQAHAPDMSGSITVQPLSGNEQHNAMPETVTLTQNFPNPFNNSTTIEFTMPLAGHAKLSVLNVLGQTVATLHDGVATAGNHSIAFAQEDLSTGIYFYKLETAQSTLIRKMLLLK